MNNKGEKKWILVMESLEEKFMETAQRLIECLNRINEYAVYKKIAATNLTAVDLRNFVSPAVLICTEIA